jgi:hypothetical protein
LTFLIVQARINSYKIFWSISDMARRVSPP